MSAEFAKIQGQVAALNKQLDAMVSKSAAVDPSGYERMAKAAALNSRTFRNAAASTGMFEVQQLKLNSATDDFIKKLQKQQLSFRDLAKQSRIAKAAYKEQLAMQQMVVRQNAGGALHGKNMVDVIFPKEAHKDLDTLGNRIGWIREQTRSAATQMVNWGKNTQWAGRQLMVGFTLPVAAFGAAAGVMAYQVDKELTRVQKVYDTTADATSSKLEDIKAVEKELNQVRTDSVKTAVYSAKEYGAAATDTLAVQAELAATGKQGAELQRTTSEVMRIATLGELEHQDALQATIALQSVFRMNNEELTSSFNYMNSIENATSLQLKDFAQAIPIAAAPVKQFGGDVKELGILLTAMKERGIGAVQGANALKAAMQRLGRPSKQIQEEFKAITGESITAIFESSENLTDIFQQIYDATDQLSKQDKTKVFAGLFGSYQVTRMSALVEGMGDLRNGVGQVSDAYRVAGQSQKDWADAADREMKRIQESVSGRFKIALESLKIEIAQMGEPFLVIATKIIEGVTSIISWFNKLPSAFKVLAGGSVALAALAGPLVMLVGLFANLGGNALKMGVFLTGALTKFELLDRESRAARLAADLASQGFVSEATAIQKLTLELQKLHMAQIAANRSSRDFRVQQMVSGGMTRSQAYAQLAAERRQDLQNAGMMNAAGVSSTYQPKTAAQMQAESAKQSAKTAANWKMVGTNVALATTGLAGFLIAGDGAVNDVAKIVFYAGLIGPMLLPLGGALKAIFAGGAKGAAKMVGILKDKGAAGLLGALKSRGGAGILGTMTQMVGKGTLITAGLAVAAGLAWKVYQNNKKAAEEQRKQEEAIYKSSAAMEHSLDIRIRKQKQLNAITPTTIRGEKTSTQLAEEYTNTKTGKSMISEYKESSGAGQQAIAMKQYLDVLNAVGGNAMKARRAVEALFIATGEDAQTAARSATSIVIALGNINDKAKSVKVFKELFASNIGEGEEAARIAGKNLGGMLADSLARATQGPERARLLNDYIVSIQSTWTDVWSNINAESRSALNDIGVNTERQLRDLMSDVANWQAGNLTDDEFTAKWNIEDINSTEMHDLLQLTAALRDSTTDTGRAVNNLIGQENEVLGVLAKQLGIKQEIYSWDQLRATDAWKMNSMSNKEATAEYKKQASELENMGFLQRSIRGINDDNLQTKQLELLNQWRIARGLKETGNLADGFGRRTRDINGFLITQNNQHKKNNAELRKQNALINSITAEQRTGLMKDAMSSFQQGIADATMSDFTSRMDGAMEAVAANAERRQNALQNQQEAASAAMDRKWENRRNAVENYYDKQIEKINKAIEAEQRADEIRQRLFEAEIARIQRLADIANQNIDFNVAINSGDLDEAAKIRNDAEAEYADFRLSSASEAGSRRSEKRQERMGNRVDAIEKERDARLQAMARVEEREKAALQRSQDRRKRALDEELRQEQTAAQKRWDTRRKYLEDSLQDFTGYIATSDADLKRHVKIWEREHKGLSLTTEGQFKISSKNIEDFLVKHVEDARRELVNGNQWEISGTKIANDMIRGAFGMSPGQFSKWLVTGKMPKDWKMPTMAKLNNNPAINQMNAQGKRNALEARHEGGVVGSGMGSRKGYSASKNTLGFHEKMIVAKDGEYVVKDQHVKNNLGLLNSINSGKLDKSAMGGAGSTNMSGAMMAGMYGAMRTTIQLATAKAGLAAMERSMAAQSKSGAGFSAGAPGMYGDRSFNATQLRNAKIISNVGKNMGMSRRDIMIGIMTAITESGLVNVKYGDRDSQGLFQQRPSQGWGTVAQVTDPVYASTKFFSALRGVGKRGDMTPWAAAQAVQRSAFADGSNYRTYWDEAQAIFKGMGKKSRGNSGLVMGSGGKHWPLPRSYKVTRGLHDTGTAFPGVDFAAPTGTPIYSVADGRVVVSKDLRGPGGYYSYGRYVVVDHGGRSSLYAHMSKRYAGVGARVKGGTRIGAVGSTGNSTGPHLHFGATGNPYSMLSLDTGAANIKYDNTFANLHKGEGVLTEDLNTKFKEGVENFANGGNAEYHVHVNGNNLDSSTIVRMTMAEFKRLERRKPRRRSN